MIGRLDVVVSEVWGSRDRVPGAGSRRKKDKLKVTPKSLIEQLGAYARLGRNRL